MVVATHVHVQVVIMDQDAKRLLAQINLVKMEDPVEYMRVYTVVVATHALVQVVTMEQDANRVHAQVIRAPVAPVVSMEIVINAHVGRVITAQDVKTITHV